MLLLNRVLLESIGFWKVLINPKVLLHNVLIEIVIFLENMLSYFCYKGSHHIFICEVGGRKINHGLLQGWRVSYPFDA